MKYVHIFSAQDYVRKFGFRNPGIFSWESRILALESVILLKKTGTPWHPKTKATNWESVIQYAGANCKIMKHIVYLLENIYNYSTEKGPWGTIRTHYTKKQKNKRTLNRRMANDRGP